MDKTIREGNAWRTNEGNIEVVSINGATVSFCGLGEGLVQHRPVSQMVFIEKLAESIG